MRCLPKWGGGVRGLRGDVGLREAKLWLVRKAGVNNALVLVHQDDILVIGVGDANADGAVAAIVHVSIAAGAIVSPQNVLGPVRLIAWLRKRFNFAAKGIDKAEHIWTELVARWLFISVRCCLWRNLLRLDLQQNGRARNQ